MTLSTEILIIGSGFGGLCMAANLRRAGLHDFLILEKAAGVGGTWRDNTYPGAECDVASALYSYSFAPNPNWDFKWAGQEQILGYLNRFADDFALTPHIQFGRSVSEAVFDKGSGAWRVITEEGEQYRCRFLVSAVGQLHHPKVPAIPGQEQFAGPAFHSAQWQHDVRLAGQNVAVIGSAASAIQLIPEIARVAKRLTVYQRSANWIIPKGNRPHSRFEKLLGRFIPGLSGLYRLHAFALGELFLYPMIKGSRLHAALGERVCRREIAKHIQDPELQSALTPDYPIGARRVLLSDQYYPALARDNVELVTDEIERVSHTGIVTTGGKEHAHDVIVYATGFRTNPFLQDMRVTGRGGHTLSEHWRGGARAYLGVMTAGYPNFFMLYGPNTNTGHSSVVYFLEAQARLIGRLIARAGEGQIEVRPEAEKAYNQELQARLSGLAWAKVEKSWYKDGQRITNNWPGRAREYARRLDRPVWSSFAVSGPAGEAAPDS